MNLLAIVADTKFRAQHIANQLPDIFETRLLSIDDLSDSEPSLFTISDVSPHCPRIPELKVWLSHRPKNAKIVFVVDKESHFAAVQASAAGATDLVSRPIDGRLLLRTLLGDISTLASDPAALATTNPGVAAGIYALQSIFDCATLGAPLDTASVYTAGESIAAQIAEDGFGRWIEIVRNHHSQTYQHCLTVTGVAVAFGQLLRFSSADQQRLATASLLHDIGKARIPLSILEKPGPLDAHERAIMEHHPLLGYQALRSVDGLQPEMLDMVVHHHEYLDGSGYPHGLKASQISDLVRTITISDIFGALIERRSYKAPLPGDQAFQILKNMGPKLDLDLVREFQSVARTHF